MCKEKRNKFSEQRKSEKRRKQKHHWGSNY